jgi:hypothetical protein
MNKPDGKGKERKKERNEKHIIEMSTTCKGSRGQACRNVDHLQSGMHEPCHLMHTSHGGARLMCNYEVNIFFLH